MSSATLHSMPYQIANANRSDVQASSTHQSAITQAYQQSPASPSRNYGAQMTPQAGADSPSATQRPSRKHSATSSFSNGQIPSQSNSPMSSRAGLPSATMSSSTGRRDNVMTAVPPRTSSQPHSHGASTGRIPASATESSKYDPRYDTNGQSSSAQQYQPTSTSEGRSRRVQSASQDAGSRANSSQREARATGNMATMPIRSQNDGHTSSRGPSRETSEILRSVQISQPEEDSDRAQERAAMAQTNAPAVQDYSGSQSIPASATTGQIDDVRRGSRSRQDHSSKREKHTRFGEYILGNTIGEGEFGKVKLGWKQEGGVQVAIKLIKKDQVGSNPTRMAKIRREVAILKQLSHPNIVRLHKMEESERHYGIVLEYASGGELFDYILNHRYLKDNAARRLFAQLVSGVGYLHKKGIVHRDLKLENLLLDRNKNIIVTDFGFANKFDPNDELTEEEEANLSDRDFIKRTHLGDLKSDGTRKGDLMQTSCGSPCYAAPELVVSDSLYTGRKVDVWSCGVILYAMLAGYLPFDDDPANPEGDNINLLYKYIVNTPLTFPEYVTPHARDLLRRILVPNPRKRADLFEVARHSWLSEYAHVVEFITSSTTAPGDVQSTVGPLEDEDGPFLGRSSSVRETSKKTAPQSVIGGLATKQGNVDQEVDDAAYSRQQKDSKRRTVQVEYVAPTTQTQRGEPPTAEGSSTRARARSSSRDAAGAPRDKPLPRDPPKDAYGNNAARRPPSSHRNNNQLTPTRPGRENARATSEQAVLSNTTGNAGRPRTGGSMASAKLGGRTDSYGQAVAPAVANANAQGRIQQPNERYPPNQYQTQDEQNIDPGRPMTAAPFKFGQASGLGQQANGASETKGHRRSNTLGELGGKIFGRNSFFGGGRKKTEQDVSGGEKGKKYPPVSMTQALPAAGNERIGRPSMESHRSRRSFGLGIGKKASGSMSGSQTSGEKSRRRFSLLPNSLSLKAIGLGKDDHNDSMHTSRDASPPERLQQETSSDNLHGDYVDQRIPRNAPNASAMDGMYAQLDTPPRTAPAPSTSRFPSQQEQRHSSAHYDRRPTGVPAYLQPQSQSQGDVLSNPSEASFDAFQGRAPSRQQANQQHGRAASSGQPLREQEGQYSSIQDYNESAGRQSARGSNRGVLQKNKRFVDAYDTDDYSRAHDHGGSSGAARRVMDFFRRRGKARGGEDR